MNLVAVSFESNRIYLSSPGAQSMYSDYLAPTSASLSYTKYFQYTCIRLCHLCMFDRAYYRSSILSMSLCIVSIKKPREQGCIYILQEVFGWFLYSSMCMIPVHMFSCKKRRYSQVSVCMVNHYKCLRL